MFLAAFYFLALERISSVASTGIKVLRTPLCWLLPLSVLFSERMSEVANTGCVILPSEEQYFVFTISSHIYQLVIL
jgi:hypothetical protein